MLIETYSSPCHLEIFSMSKILTQSSKEKFFVLRKTEIILSAELVAAKNSKDE